MNSSFARRLSSINFLSFLLYCAEMFIVKKRNNNMADIRKKIEKNFEFMLNKFEIRNAKIIPKHGFQKSKSFSFLMKMKNKILRIKKIRLQPVLCSVQNLQERSLSLMQHANNYQRRSHVKYPKPFPYQTFPFPL